MIAVAGISYYSAGFEGLAAFTDVAGTFDGCDNRFSGAVWVKTCNRVELYADLPLHCNRHIEKILLQQFGLTEKPDGFYIYLDDEALLHLLKVAGGLDSAITGEDQVLYQLKDAYKNALSQNLSSPLLNKAFHKAFETGKNIRNLTDINKGRQSVASIAAALVGSFTVEYPGQGQPEILLIGAGETGSLVADILVDKGFGNIHVWNRSASKARKLAARLHLKVVETAMLESHYQHSTVVLVAIRNREPLLNYAVALDKPGQKRMIVDLSMPFQVPATVENNDNFLYNLSHIADIRRQTLEKRKEAIEDAMQLIWGALHELKEWKDHQWIGRTLQQWKILLDTLQERERNSFLKKFPATDREMLSAFGNELTAAMLRQLAWSIRQQQQEGSEWNQWSKLLANVEPYEQLN